MFGNYRNGNPNVGCSYILKANKTLRKDYDLWIDRDIILEPSSTLIVEEKISMAVDTNIIMKDGAKLKINNGTITSC